MIRSVPVNNIVFHGNEKKYLAECIDSGWISSEGPFIEKFETQFSQYIGRKHGVAVSSGSAALDIAVLAAGVTEGDEVIMPTFTIISPAFSVVRAGAIPVLVDCDPETFNMDTAEIESKITSKTRAIIIVHIYGLPVKVDEVLALAKKYNLKVIEDAAEMHGQTYDGKKCGTFGDISIFSFYPNKVITTGEGGMILCDDYEVARHCMKLRNLAFSHEGPRFIHDEIGYNYRMTNMQAALGVAQLEQIDVFIEKKRAVGKFYNEQLGFISEYGYRLPVPETAYAENIYWVYGIVAPGEEQKKLCVEHLSKNKIGTRPFFYCMHKQPVLKQLNLFNNEVYPNAEKLSANGFYIPSGLGLTEEELEKVVKTFSAFFEKQFA
jgi:perosamine synthetase